MGGRKIEVHIPTVAALAATAVSVNVAFHEGVHAITTVLLGGRVAEYSALYVIGETGSAGLDRIVSGSASIANIALGLLMIPVLRGPVRRTPWAALLVWLFLLMNLLYGAGYWMFSGAAGIGDWASVFSGVEPTLLWRAPMFLVGSALFILFVRLALGELGRIIGGSPGEQIGRATRICVVSYFASLLTIAAAGAFCPEGPTSLPVIAGLAAAAGALSPLCWMTQRLRSPGIAKPAGPPLLVSRSYTVIGAAAAVVFAYVFLLGRTIYF